MRKLISLDENWTLSFPKGERLAEKVTLPHTWNAVDSLHFVPISQICVRKETTR